MGVVDFCRKKLTHSIYRFIHCRITSISNAKNEKYDNFHNTIKELMLYLLQNEYRIHSKVMINLKHLNLDTEKYFKLQACIFGKDVNNAIMISDAMET